MLLSDPLILKTFSMFLLLKETYYSFINFLMIIIHPLSLTLLVFVWRTRKPGRSSSNAVHWDDTLPCWPSNVSSVRNKKTALFPSKFNKSNLWRNRLDHPSHEVWSKFIRYNKVLGDSDIRLYHCKFAMHVTVINMWDFLIINLILDWLSHLISFILMFGPVDSMGLNIMLFSPMIILVILEYIF